MTRIADLAAKNQMLDIMLRTQKRVHQLEMEVATGKVSFDYAGISRQSLRLLRLEASHEQLQRFVANNTGMQTRLEVTKTTVEGLRETVRDFRRTLLDLGGGKPLEPQTIEDLQGWAFRALLDMQSYLNTDVDGRFLFAGGRVDAPPVDLGLTTLADFQARFDGSGVVYPPTRASHVETDLSLAPAVTGGLTMTGTDTITAANPGSFARLKVGMTITLSGSALSNDGTYTVVSSNGSDQITIAGAMTAGPATINVVNAVNNGAEAAATISAGDYYAGDTVALTHRVDNDRFFNLDLTAIDPAFEKAIRAMGIIAQGALGTPGGLDQNMVRIDQAIELVNSALDRAAGGAPFGAEIAGNLEQVTMDLGFHELMIGDALERHEQIIASLENGIADIENVETVEAVTRLIDQSQALEASYQAIARVNRISLTQFL
jgi:flagellin-like hook-associated protein FlgL